MKKTKFFGVISIVLITTLLVIYACDNDDAALNSNTQVFQKIPEYNPNLYGEVLKPRSDKNMCSCANAACAVSKHCTAPADCTCTCTDSFWSGSSCTCTTCVDMSSYDLYLTDIQYDFWEDLSTILQNDGTTNAILAQDALLDALDAVAEDNFANFDASKSAMRQYCGYLSSTTKGIINNFLTTNNFVDVLN